MTSDPRQVVKRALYATLFWAGAILMPGAALATTLDHYITVQAIDVCSDTGSGCAPINSLGQTVLTNPGTTQIGFVDPLTQANSTQLILSQSGINVTFLPAEQYVNPAFTSLSVTNCTNGAISCLTSIGFQGLSQQPGISGPPPNPPNPPAPPLAPSLTTMNMFFVGTLTPNVPGLLYGFSWINNNGVSIGVNTFAPPFGLPGRPDTIAHEIGHNLDLDHTTFGAGPVNGVCAPSCRTNLMTAGNLRTEPSNSLLPNGQAAWVGQIFPNGALDQLNPAQISQMLSSGFVSGIPNVTTNVSAPPVPAATRLAALSAAAAAVPPSGAGDFSVSFDNPGRPGESLKTLTLTAPDGFALTTASFRLLNLPEGVVVTPQFSGCLDSGFSPGACKILRLTLSGAPFVQGERFDYTVDVCSIEQGLERGFCQTVPFNNLAGGTYKYQFSDGYETTSRLTGSDQLTANSWNPDPNIPASIYDEALLVAANAGKLPCTPDPVLGCLNNPLDVGIRDGDPREEGGQPVPEPPTIAILLAGLALVFLLHHRIAPRRV